MARSRSRRPVLLFAPYQAPAVRVGDRATCRFRDAGLVIHPGLGSTFRPPVTSGDTAGSPHPKSDASKGAGARAKAHLPHSERPNSAPAPTRIWSFSSGGLAILGVA